VNISRCKRFRSSMFRFRFLTTAVVALFLAAPAFGQTGTSPWENAVSVLQQAFTSTIARGLSLVAIVVAGLTFVPNELIPINPLGMSVTYFREDQAFK
jgi:type IV secretory pathway VirB2 component (pilin)